jgi:hypothetical protein
MTNPEPGKMIDTTIIKASAMLARTVAAGVDEPVVCKLV